MRNVEAQILTHEAIGVGGAQLCCVVLRRRR